jgi:VanZ family protein
VKKAPVQLARLAYLWAPVACYAAFIYFLSSLSFGHPLFQKVEKNHADKLFHIVEYTLFGYLLARALWRHSPIWGSRTRVLVAVLLAGSLYAASDEWHQRWVPLRDPAPTDFAADVAGLACGAWLWMRKQGRIDA